ncbi:DUF1292 domain-containing protein [Cohnella yongneupensis]|uniref:DUF1292 domain-containing protein n=1 Tax=Cohnella yongneupensis TaxID=425006 RepID=A0ABW0R9H4_9BACL
MIESGALKRQFGDSIELNGESEVYAILAELSLNGSSYAILQSEAMQGEDAIEVFRIVADAEGILQLETVEDDDEWEAVSEAYDDAQFGSDDQP